MKQEEKNLSKNVALSLILALEEWYGCMLEGELSYIEKKNYNNLMKHLVSYRKKLEKNASEDAMQYLEHNKEYFINVTQALYDEQLKIITNEKE